MPLPCAKPIGGTLKPLLGVDHVAGGKAVLAAPVLPQRHQFRRGPHRAHGLVALILACAVPVDRKSVVYGQSVSVRVDPGGRLTIKKYKRTTREPTLT